METTRDANNMASLTSRASAEDCFACRGVAVGSWCHQYTPSNSGPYNLDDRLTEEEERCLQDDLPRVVQKWLDLYGDAKDAKDEDDGDAKGAKDEDDGDGGDSVEATIDV